MSTLDALEALAREATPGPWSQGLIGNCLIAEVDYSAAFGFIKVTEQTDDGAEGVVDAAFIAACSPDVILRLKEIEAH